MTRARDVANIDGLLTTTGDTYYASAAATPARLGIGTTGQLLTVAGGVPTWAAAPAAGSMTLLSTTSLTGATTTISSISQDYKSLYMIITGVTNATSTDAFTCKPNNVSNLSNQIRVDTSGIWTGNNINTSIRLTPASSAGSLFTNANNSWAFTINNYTSTTAFKPFSIYGAFQNPGNNQGFACFGSFNSNTAISSLVFAADGGNLSTGTVLLYGVN